MGQVHRPVNTEGTGLWHGPVSRNVTRRGGGARAAEAEIVYLLTEKDWGLRRFFVRDPNGAVIKVTEHACA